MSPPIALQPLDVHNRELESHVHPPDWINPTPSGRYNLVVIGGGTAGLVSAIGAAGLGAKVALIERDLLGGDCLNVGCVPSKALIASARAAAAIRNAPNLGVGCDSPPKVRFEEVMRRMRRLRASISPNDSAARFRDAGVDVFLGSGTFLDRQTIEVAGAKLSFKKAVIATGARAAALPIPGLEQTGVLTNESVFSLTELPPRLTVIGGGPIGCEMAQSFARFGSHVTLVEKHSRILAREDADAASVVQAALARDGVELKLETQVERMEARGDAKVVVCRRGDSSQEVISDAILVGIGRAPNVDGMGLDQAGVSYDSRNGVEVNDRLQTSNPNIFAAGDVASEYKFTHAADFMARTVIRNALFLGRGKASDLIVPWSTYTSPELAHVGLTPDQAAVEGIEIETFTQSMEEIDRAILESSIEGFVRVHVKRGSDQIVGATVVSDHAGDLISEITLAMNHKIGLKKIANSIHPYPTQAEAIRKLGDQYNRTRLTPTVQNWMGRWLRWTR